MSAGQKQVRAGPGQPPCAGTTSYGWRVGGVRCIVQVCARRLRTAIRNPHLQAHMVTLEHGGSERTKSARTSTFALSRGQHLPQRRGASLGNVDSEAWMAAGGISELVPQSGAPSQTSIVLRKLIESLSTPSCGYSACACCPRRAHAIGLGKKAMGCTAHSHSLSPLFLPPSRRGQYLLWLPLVRRPPHPLRLLVTLTRPVAASA